MTYSVSVFQKIGIPKFIINNGAEICDKNNRMMHCTVEINEGEICPGDKVHSAVHWRKFALEKTQRKVTKVNELMSFSNRGITKRGILSSILGAGTGLGLGMLFSAISTHRLSKHIDNLQQEFDTFKAKEVKALTKFTAYVNNNLEILDGTISKVETNVKWLECTQAMVYQQSLANFQLLSWERLLSDIFVHVDEGSLGGKLSGRILQPEELKILINKHPKLRKTAYFKNIMNFYISSRIVIVSANIENDDLLLHYVIVAPLIFSGNEFPLYKVEQIPILYNNTCMRTVLHEYVFLRHGKYVGLAKDSCIINELVSFCYEQIEENRTCSCLQRSNTCTLQPANCNILDYVYDYSGVMIRGTGTLFYLKRNVVVGELRIQQRNFSKFGVAFVSWVEAEYIQYKDIRVESPEYITTVIHENYTLDMERIWFQMITSHVNQSDKRKIELLTAKSLGIMNLDTPILKHKEGWIIYLALSLSCSSFVLVCFIIFRKTFTLRRCNLCNYRKHKSTKSEQPITSSNSDVVADEATPVVVN